MEKFSNKNDYKNVYNEIIMMKLRNKFEKEGKQAPTGHGSDFFKECPLNALLRS